MTRGSLRRRIVVGVVGFTVLISLATSLLGYWVNEQAEQRVWEAMFQSELGHQILHRAGAPGPDLGSDSLLLFGKESGRPVPQAFQSLEAGVHDEVKLGDRLYVVAVDGAGDTVLALDISDMEQRESNLVRLIALAALFIVLALASVTYLGARWLVSPLSRLSLTIGSLQPGTRGQRVESPGSDPAEVEVIARSLNEYLRQIDSYVEREQRFLIMASHELRTPIAVLSGAAEVAEEQTSIEDMRPHISRIRSAARGMGELVSMLLALAREPSRLADSAVPVDIAKLIPRIISDHEHLLLGKELQVRLGALPRTVVTVPESLLASALGNLVRNAIENSSRGIIDVSLNTDGVVTIEDSGSAMSAGERNRLQARLARAGQGRSDGIGLDLVARLCDHLGWRLNLAPREAGGTVATLAFGVTEHTSRT